MQHQGPAEGCKLFRERELKRKFRRFERQKCQKFARASYESNREHYGHHGPNSRTALLSNKRRARTRSKNSMPGTARDTVQPPHLVGDRKRSAFPKSLSTRGCGARIWQQEHRADLLKCVCKRRACTASCNRLGGSPHGPGRPGVPSCCVRNGRHESPWARLRPQRRQSRSDSSATESYQGSKATPDADPARCAPIAPPSGARKREAQKVQK